MEGPDSCAAATPARRADADIWTDTCGAEDANALDFDDLLLQPSPVE